MILRREEHPVRVLDALELLLYASSRGSAQIFQRILDVMLEYLVDLKSWKHDRYLQRASLLMYPFVPNRTRNLEKLMKNPKLLTSINSKNSEDLFKSVDFMFGRMLEEPE